MPFFGAGGGGGATFSFLSARFLVVSGGGGGGVFLSCRVVVPVGCSGRFAVSGDTASFTSASPIISLANSLVVRATVSMLLTISNRAANGRNNRYFVLPIFPVRRLFIILIRFFNGKTLKLLDNFAAALW